MRVWMLKEGENLPLQPGSRKMRAWLLAEALLARGHEVTWWASTFSHQQKTLFAQGDLVQEVQPGLTLRLVHAGVYRRNVSLRRYLHHLRLAARFARVIRALPQPDLVLTACPPIDFAAEAVRYAKSRGIPVVVDVQDVWPDAIIQALPRWIRPLATRGLRRDAALLGRTLADASGVTAVSSGFLHRCLGYAGRARRHQDGVFHLGYPALPPAGGPSPRLAEFRRAIEGKVVFTYVGSFGRSYEVSLIVRVARRLAGRGDHRVHWAIAGDGEQMQALQRETRGLDSVSLLGWLSGDELSELLSLSHVGLAPCIQDRDTMSNKPFEYFSAGLPILSSLEGEMERLIEENQLGYSYHHGDEAALDALVSRLASDAEERRRLGANAARLFERRFRAETVYGEMVEHLEMVARGDDAPRGKVIHSGTPSV